MNTEFSQFLEGRPALHKLVQLILNVWPGHEAFLVTSLKSRTPDMLQTSDDMADVVLQLAKGREEQVAEDYVWLCEQIREEEIHFARTDAYRYSTFAETNANVYSDNAFMERYMHGLLYSHVLWYMHASSLHFFRQRLAARVKPGGKVMEVGSGHGLLIYLALTELGMDEAVAWDISEISLAQTRHALESLGAAERARYAIQDMHKVQPDAEKFDLIILSHLLEHLEDPVDALQKLRHAVTKGAYLFVNVPLNAPMPDHLQLWRDPADVIRLLEDGGFRMLEIASHTTQALPLPKALKRKIAVTCSVIAEPA